MIPTIIIGKKHNLIVLIAFLDNWILGSSVGVGSEIVRISWTLEFACN